MKSLLLVIDLQNEFINDNTRYLIKKRDKLIDSKKYDDVLFTRFINDSRWDNILEWDGCKDKESIEIPISTRNYKVVDKSIYTSLNDEVRDYIRNNNIDIIYLCGISTDCCVLKTALDMFEEGYNVKVLKDYSMCTVGINTHLSMIDMLSSLRCKSLVKEVVKFLCLLHLMDINSF